MVCLQVIRTHFVENELAAHCRSNFNILLSLVTVNLLFLAFCNFNEKYLFLFLCVG